jgi:hypothetical protein
MKREITYLIIKETLDGKIVEIEEIKTNDMDVVLQRVSELMQTTDLSIHIWEKEDYESYKKRERELA